MKILTELERLQKIHQLIKGAKTGTPKEFAKRLSISESHLYYVLDNLKVKDFPIVYSRKLKSYQYSSYCHLKVELSITIYTETGNKNIKLD